MRVAVERSFHGSSRVELSRIPPIYLMAIDERISASMHSFVAKSLSAHLSLPKVDGVVGNRKSVCKAKFVVLPTGQSS